MQSRRASNTAAIALLSLWFTSCIGWGDCRDRWESAGYCIADCEYEGNVFLSHEEYPFDIVPPTVFAIDADSRYIVVKQHPTSGVFESFRFDRSVTYYYIVERTVGKSVDGWTGVQGPLNEPLFKALRKQLSLPEFSKTFRDLE